jgi:hypothetical protein
MNIDDLQNKLLAAARTREPSDAVPYAFEKRIMAHLAQVPPFDVWNLWGKALWKAAAPCVAITLLVGLLTFAIGADPHEINLADLETTVMAPLENPEALLW